MNPVKWFRIQKPKSLEDTFKGARLTCYPTSKDAWQRTNGERLVVEHIAGNLTHQTMFQVNGSHLVSMLDAFSEINGEALPNQQMHEDFLSTVATKIEAAPHTPSLIDRLPAQELGHE